MLKNIQKHARYQIVVLVVLVSTPQIKDFSIFYTSGYAQCKGAIRCKFEFDYDGVISILTLR